jgi:hypothetical protein
MLPLQEKMTNPFRTYGFGAQYAEIISNIVYAGMTNKLFLYTPFAEMEFNTDNDCEFLNKKEDLINIYKHFPINNDRTFQQRFVGSCLGYFLENIDTCVKHPSFHKVKEVFNEGKNKSNVFNNKNLNISIHIRRPNQGDSISCSNVENIYYLKIIDTLRKKHHSDSPLFHIYSNDDLNHMKIVYSADDILLHINESIERTFIGMVFADILFVAPSGLSFCAGLLSDGIVYYVPWWRASPSHWIKGQELDPNLPSFIAPGQRSN